MVVVSVFGILFIVGRGAVELNLLVGIDGGVRGRERTVIIKIWSISIQWNPRTVKLIILVWF